MAKQNDVKVMGTEIELLPVKLTTTELLEKGQQLADVEQRCYDHEAHADAVKKNLKAEETKLLAERARLATIVRSKAEHREVRCDIVYDYSSLEVLRIRQDTGDTVSSRPMQEGERQRVLSLDEQRERAASTLKLAATKKNKPIEAEPETDDAEAQEADEEDSDETDAE